MEDILAPTYYKDFANYTNVKYRKEMIDIEWRAQLQSSTQKSKFRIKYYGDILKNDSLIIDTDFSKALLYAEDIESGERIILFDGCKHGYNAMFCDEYTSEQITNRPLSNTYTNKKGNTVFEIYVNVIYGINYEEEMDSFLSKDGYIELYSNEIISLDTLKRNGFDFIEIKLVDEEGKEIKIIEEELA